MSYKKLLDSIKRTFRLSENDIAKICGIHQGTVNKIASGKTNLPFSNTILKLEKGLNIIIDDSDPNNITFKHASNNDTLTRILRHHSADVVKQITRDYKSADWHTYKLYSPIGAGSVFPYNDEPYEFITLPYHDPECFALRVVGDSMAPRIEHGDVVLISPNIAPAIYDIVAVRTSSGEHLIKRLIYTDDLNVHLFSDNPTVPIRVFPRSDISQLFKVVSAIKRFTNPNDNAPR